MSATSKQKLAKRMMWAARVIGLLTAAFSLMFLIVDTIVRMTMQQGGFIEDVLKAMPVVVAVAGCIVSWWRQRLAGTLLVLASFALSSLNSRYYNGFLALVSGFPYLVAGVLFLLSWWLTRKNSSL